MRVVAGKNNTPMPEIFWPPINGTETLEELEDMIQPQIDAWLQLAYSEYKIQKTTVRLSRVGDKLWLDFFIDIEPTDEPMVVHGIGCTD